MVRIERHSVNQVLVPYNFSILFIAENQQISIEIVEKNENLITH